MNQNLREHVIATFLIDAMRLQRSEVGRELRVCATVSTEGNKARHGARRLCSQIPALHVMSLGGGSCTVYTVLNTPSHAANRKPEMKILLAIA